MFKTVTVSSNTNYYQGGVVTLGVVINHESLQVDLNLLVLDQVWVKLSLGQNRQQVNRKHDNMNSPAQCKCVGSGKLERNPPSLELQGPVQRKKGFF